MSPSAELHAGPTAVLEAVQNRVDSHRRMSRESCALEFSFRTPLGVSSRWGMATRTTCACSRRRGGDGAKGTARRHDTSRGPPCSSRRQPRAGWVITVPPDAAVRGKIVAIQAAFEIYSSRVSLIVPRHHGADMAQVG